MAVLGEDPARYSSLLHDVVNSYPPQNPLELHLCEEITQLMLRLERTRQVQEAKVVRSYQKLESAREKRQREMEGSASYDALQADVLETGLRLAPDSAAKFSEMSACLQRLLKQVEDLDFSKETDLNALYGKRPTFRGAGIINAFRQLAKNRRDAEFAGSLRLMILEEIRDVAAQSDLYYREHVEVSPAMRRECLVPAGDPEYLELHRHEADLGRQLERKIKLLLTLRAAGGASEEEAGTVNEPVGWLEAHAESAVAPAPAVGADTDKPGAGRDCPAGTPSPEDMAGARAIAMQFKVEAPPRAGGPTNQLTPEMLRRIQEVYGLTPDEPEEPEAAPLNLAYAFGGREPTAQHPTDSQGEGAPLQAGGKDGSTG
jgi:hypothetical protein